MSNRLLKHRGNIVTRFYAEVLEIYAEELEHISALKSPRKPEVMRGLKEFVQTVATIDKMQRDTRFEKELAKMDEKQFETVKTDALRWYKDKQMKSASNS